MNGHGEDRITGLAEALNLFVTLTGFDKDRSSVSIRDMGVLRMHRQLQEALKLDPSDATAFMMLTGFCQDYFANRTFSVNEMLDDAERTREYVLQASRLKQMLASPEVQDIGTTFMASVRASLEHYNIPLERVSSIIVDPFLLGILRRDALRSMQTLVEHQFMSGQREEADVAPVCPDHIHLFWNVNSLLKACYGMPSGVSLNLIRDPDVNQSYFVFAIRNGANVWLLSDVPEDAHPLQRFTSRRPGRELSERAEKNWFPYGLMNLEHDYRGDLFQKPSDSSELVAYNEVCQKMKPLAELEAGEVLWITMMYDLIVRRYWREGHVSPQLSYTGEMLHTSDVLLETASKSSLPVSGYQALVAAPLTTSDVISPEGSSSNPAYGSDAGRPNQWLEDRYAAGVSEDILNLSSASGAEQGLLEDGTIVPNRSELPLGSKSIVMHAFNPTLFGSEDKVRSDRLFVARHNLARAVHRLAEEEFKARHAEVEAWYLEAVTENLDNLLPYAARPTEHPSGTGMDGMVVRVKTLDEDRAYPNLRQKTIIHGGYRTQGGVSYLCPVNFTASSFYLDFEPSSPEDLAALAGCNPLDLPDVLQHWRERDRPAGNHLLDRIDPMAWAVKNPWTRFPARVRVPLSKRAYAKIMKGKTP